MAPFSDSLPPRLLGTVPAAGVAAGTPGKFTPWNARRPANLAALQALGPLGQVAAWAPGQSVELRDGSRAHWDGDSWAAGPAPAPVGAAADPGDGTQFLQVSASSGPEASAGTVPDGTVLGAPVEDDQGQGPGVVVTADGAEHVGILPAGAAVPPEQVLESDPDSPVPGTVERLDDEAAAALIAAGPLPPVLTVTAGTPGTYDPAVKAAERPRNVTELQQRATPADAAPWSAGEYVPVGERGKAAHWDGSTWRSGKASA